MPDVLPDTERDETPRVVLPIVVPRAGSSERAHMTFLFAVAGAFAVLLSLYVAVGGGHWLFLPFALGLAVVSAACLWDALRGGKAVLCVGSEGLATVFHNELIPWEAVESVRLVEPIPGDPMVEIALNVAHPVGALVASRNSASPDPARFVLSYEPQLPNQDLLHAVNECLARRGA